MASLMIEAFNFNGHIYATPKGYVSIQVFVKDRAMGDYVANLLKGRVYVHKSIFVVIVSRRKSIEYAAARLLQDRELRESHRTRLSLALRYAKALNKADRRDLALLLRTPQVEETDAKQSGTA